MQAARRQRGRHLECMRGEDVRAAVVGLVEEAVAPHAVTAERRDAIRDLEGGIAVDAWGLHPGRLGRRVVGHLVLEEDVSPAVAVPDHVELLEVLDEKAVGGDVVSIDDDAGVGRVDRPPHAGAVVGAPRPDVVQDHVLAVHRQRGRHSAGGRASDAEENVGKDRRVRGLVVASRVSVADLKQNRGGRRSGVEQDAGDEHSLGTRDRHRRVAVGRHQGRKP